MIATRMLPLESSPAMDESAMMSRVAASLHASDDELAHIIGMFGRQTQIRATVLPRLFVAFPNILARPIVLDAVLESVLRGESRAGRTKAEVARDLQSQFPELKDAIDVAVALGSIITTGTGDAVVTPFPDPPFEIGPSGPGGERRYSVRTLISRGKQGSVFLATDTTFSREGRSSLVAIKIANTPSAHHLFDRKSTQEAVRARQVRHPNVAVAYDRGFTDDNRAFTVFEYVEGGSLHDRWNANRDGMPARDAAELVVKVCRGVAAIHASGILHLDIKPGNVLMDRHGEPKVTDFGIAIDQATCGTDTVQPSDQIGGTLGFAAPEQFLLGAMLDARADTYSLGGLLLSLLTGRAANGSSAEEATRLLSGSGPEQDGPVNPSLVALVRDDVLRDICAKATSRSPSRRYLSADALAADIERWQRDEPLRWRHQTRWASASQWVRRERRVVVTVALLSAIVCAAGGLVVRSTLRNEQFERDSLEAKHKADVSEKERLLAAEKHRTLTRNLQTMIRTLRNLDSSSVSEGWLAQVAFVEGFYGPVVFGNDETGKQLWNERVERAKAIAREIRDQSPGSSITALQWDLLAGVWLLTSGDAVGARTHLAIVQAEANAVLPATDGIRDLIDKLHASAVVLSIAESEVPLSTTDEKVASAVNVLKRPDASETARSGDGVKRVLASARARVHGE